MSTEFMNKAEWDAFWADLERKSIERAGGEKQLIREGMRDEQRTVRKTIQMLEASVANWQSRWDELEAKIWKLDEEIEAESANWTGKAVGQ